MRSAARLAGCVGSSRGPLAYARGSVDSARYGRPMAAQGDKTKTATAKLNARRGYGRPVAAQSDKTVAGAGFDTAARLGGLAGAGCLPLRFEASRFTRDGRLHLEKDVSDAPRVVETLKELGEAFHTVF